MINLTKVYFIATLLLSTIASQSCTKKAASTITRSTVKVDSTLSNQSRSARSTPMIIDSIVAPLDTNCHIDGPVIAQARDFEGYVYYLGTTKLYSITYTVPNTIDTQWIGYVCNMPEEFKRGSLKVMFSGKYYHAYKHIKHPGIDGHPQLYLVLEKIRMM